MVQGLDFRNGMSGQGGEAMPERVLNAAQYLADQSPAPLTHLQLQKLLYLGHMVHLGVHRSGLVTGHFEAWDFGPVHPTLYHSIKHFGSKPIDHIPYGKGVIDGVTEESVMDYIVSTFSHQSGPELVRITHWEKGAWWRNYRPSVRGIVIPDADIEEEYREIMKLPVPNQ